MICPSVVHHSAALDRAYPPNSLDAVEASLAYGAACIEIDIAALADSDFISVHDLDLSSMTTGAGLAADCSSSAARDLRYKDTDIPVALLSEIVDAVDQAGDSCRLQLDLKDEHPYLTAEPVARLLRLIEPIADRVILTSGADWQLRAFREIAPSLALGFDPLLYFGWWPPEFPAPEPPPHRMGAYGYLDDHPLAARRDLPTSRYLAIRAEMLLDLLPGIEVFYLYHHVISRSFDDGFDWPEACHSRGIKLDAWTLDLDREGMAERVRRLAHAGIDMVTTNTPREMSELLATIELSASA